MTQQQYACAKCGCQQYTTDQIRTTGSGFSRFFNVQNRVFNVVSCQQCGFSEMYKSVSSGASNVLDFMMG